MKSALEWLKMRVMSLSGKECADKGKCFETLELYLDGEVSDEEAKAAQKRIENCMPCYERHNLDKAVKKALVSRLKIPSVPPEMENQILDNLKKEE